MGFIYAIDKWNADVLKAGFKLSQYGLAKVLSGNTGAV